MLMFLTISERKLCTLSPCAWQVKIVYCAESSDYNVHMHILRQLQIILWCSSRPECNDATWLHLRVRLMVMDGFACIPFLFMPAAN